MKFVSTKNRTQAVSVSQAISMGISPDGGLFVPETLPQFDLHAFQGVRKFQEVACLVLKPFFEGDSLYSSLEGICADAFSFPIVLKDVQNSITHQNSSVLELFHGPTAAFKDFGARFLAECLLHYPSDSARTILVATSGDTGGAVASAFFKKQGFKVILLFPKHGVSERQKRQLTGFGENVRAFAVNGTFDDCQKLVKEGLSDPTLSQHHFSSANSINVGRLLPQSTYYAWASLEYLRKHGARASFIIPSGNLGNSVAALWAKQMGFPIEKIGLATNANHVVPDYFKNGKWKPAPSVPTLANAMDVGNPSNMERYFHLETQFKDLKENVFSVSVSDEEIRHVIRNGITEFGEIWCPHTATAVHVRNTSPLENCVIVSTAHPAKFETIVEPFIGRAIDVPPSLQKLLNLKSSFEEIDASYENFRDRIK